MWHLGIVLAAAAIAPATPAETDDAAIRRIVRTAYAGFVNPNAPPPITPYRVTRRLEAVQRECAAMQARIDAIDGDGASHGECSEDYEVLCQCQDTGDGNWARMRVAILFPAPNRAEAVLTFRSKTPDLKLIFARTPAGWAVDDYWEYGIGADGGEASQRKRLGAYIAKARARLKLPAWKEPAL